MTTSASESLWLQTAPPVGYPDGAGDVEVDVAVLGGGIAGLTTALLLKRSGARVAVVEADRVGGGVTGCTTAKVSALQSTVYSTIQGQHGGEAAAVYAEASLAGVERIATIAAEEDIDCDLERRPALTYAAGRSERESVEREAEAAANAGLSITRTESTDLPYEVDSAIRLDDQIEFHPVRYSQGLAAAIAGDGSHVLERTRALGLTQGSPCSVRTSGGTVTAERVVVATHYPLLDRGLYFARLEAERSYCIAARVRGQVPLSMSISAGSNARSVRSYRDLLIVGGEGHPAGATQAGERRYERLEEFAREHWEVEAVAHRWSAQDPVPYDHLPIVGSYIPGSSRVYVTSGFMKWGLSGATFAAVILCDLLGGSENQWAATFQPHRLSLRSSPALAKMNAEVALDLVGDRLKPAEGSSAAAVPVGEARVVRNGLKKTGVYRDDEGMVHSVSLRCTHLGCLLRFNAAERSWDCPCHGSRFDVDGAVLEGPATKPLEQR